MKSKSKNSGRPTVYPWDRWFSKSRFRIERGRHFNCQPHAMANQIRNTAAKRKKRVSISIEEDVIKVEVGRQ